MKDRNTAVQAGAAMLGLAAPVAVGVLTGHVELWMAAALGGLALSGGAKGRTTGQRALSLLASLAAGTAAMATGIALSGCGIAGAFSMPLIAAVVGLLGGISRPLARASTQFVLYAIIASGIGSRGSHPYGVAFLFFLGAAWTACLSLAMQPLFGLVFPASGTAPTEEDAAPRRIVRQLVHRWRGTLAHVSGWQYSLRILSCLAAAQAVELVWPLPHGYWVGITVGIVVHRDLRVARARTPQRAVGTLLGVLLACLLLLGPLPGWALVCVVAALAAARPILRELNYTAYAAAHTPLIMILMSFGSPLSWTVLEGRLAATVVGCAIAVLIGLLPWLALGRRSDAPPRGTTASAPR